MKSPSVSIPQATVDEIKARIDIVDVIGDFVNLKKSGQSFKGLSPFTNEKTPSFFVVPSKNIFKCFSSGKGGDAINFLMEYDGLSYVDALRYLAEKYGIEIQEREITPEEIKAQNERESLFIVLNWAKEYFKKNLHEHSEGKTIGLEYLRERAVSDDAVIEFGIGYSLESWDDLFEAAKKAGFSEEILEKAGLIVKKEDKVYDRFRGRLVFPIHNQTGKVVAFGARTLKRESKQPKYINSPESDVYHKSRILYGLHTAKGAIRKEDNSFLVEGYTDVIGLWQHGFHNVVASSGTSLTEDQVRLLKRYSENITILFDGDEAGIRASLRGIDLLLAGGLNVKAVVLPDGQDPDSYVQERGGFEFKKFLDEQSQDFIRFTTGLYLKGAGEDPVKKAQVVTDILETISKIPDSIKRTIYIKEASTLLEMDEAILVSEMNKLLLKGRKRGADMPEQGLPPIPYWIEEKVGDTVDVDFLSLSQVIQERENMRSLVRYGLRKVDESVFLYQYLFDELDDVQFETPVYNEILTLFRRGISDKGQELDTGYLLENGSEEVRKEIIDLITDRYEISEHWEGRHRIYVPQEEEILDRKVYTDMLRLKLTNLKKMIKSNLIDLQNAASNSDQDKFQKIHVELKKAEKQIADVLGIIISQ